MCPRHDSSLCVRLLRKCLMVDERGRAIRQGRLARCHQTPRQRWRRWPPCRRPTRRWRPRRTSSSSSSRRVCSRLRPDCSCGADLLLCTVAPRVKNACHATRFTALRRTVQTCNGAVSRAWRRGPRTGPASGWTSRWTTSRAAASRSAFRLCQPLIAARAASQCPSRWGAACKRRLSLSVLEVAAQGQI